MRHPNLLLVDRVRKQAKRRGREPRDYVSSILTPVTGMIPWSNGEDAWVTTRKVMVQLHPGSLCEEWSVGVLAAHLLGKEEDPVQLRGTALAIILVV